MEAAPYLLKTRDLSRGGAVRVTIPHGDLTALASPVGSAFLGRKIEVG